MTTTYRDPLKVVEETCAEWRRLGLRDDPSGVAMAVIDELAVQEGFVDADGNGIDSDIDLAASEFMAAASRWFAANPKEG